MLDRRRFLQSLMAGAATIAFRPQQAFGGLPRATVSYFALHPFIEAHPTAVFVMRTNVDVKTNSAAVKQAGWDFGSSVFLPSATPGIPLTHRVVVKPNIVMMPVPGPPYMGIVTDCYFVEGVIESLKQLGVPGNQFYIREANYPEHFENSGYLDMAARTGADIRALSAPIGEISESDIQWVDVPNGKWFKRIPFLWPVNAPDTWLLNIAKFKSHTMGMSLCAKNLQGANAFPYIRHCTVHGVDMGLEPGHVWEGAPEQILADYERHRAAGIPRWDRPGKDGGLLMETWATRCLDNNSVTPAGLHIIEGIYGREGPFLAGPAPDGSAIDHLTNLIIFGKNPFHVDLIGHWLAGHEPGNFGLFHLAIERGLASILNPYEVPLYEWKAGIGAVFAAPESFPRYALRTPYLRRDYDGQEEPEWHLVNEPYVYSKTTTKNIAVGTGWNLVSLPVRTGNSQLSNLLPAAASMAFSFEQEYHSEAELTPGRGYWVKFDAVGAFPVTGSPVVPQTVTVNKGWNLIGPFDTDVPVASVVTLPGGILDSAFFGYSGGYHAATTLESGKGYWVKADQGGDLRFVNWSGKTIAAHNRDMKGWTNIEVVDALGRRSVLSLADPAELPRQRELPPIPPGGTFDIRFRNNCYVEARGDTHELVVSSARFPVTVTATCLNGMTLRLVDKIGAGLVNADLEEGQPVVIAKDAGNLLLSGGDEIPAAYELFQNHPNPFNAQTVIRYAVPCLSIVSLVVFNALGETVADLVHETQKAGTHNVRFDATPLPSGMYFLRLVAGPSDQTDARNAFNRNGGSDRFVSTIRMILVK